MQTVSCKNGHITTATRALASDTCPAPHLQDKRRAKEAAATQAARAQREDRLAHLLAASKLDDLGVHLHHVLKHYPHIRAKWLAGESLLSLLDERKCAFACALFALEGRPVRWVKGCQKNAHPHTAARALAQLRLC